MVEKTFITAPNGDTYYFKDAGARTLIEEKAPKASPEFTESVSLGRRTNTTTGYNSSAIGDVVTASAAMSHAEGYYTTASKDAAHAEGDSTTASGRAAHAEGGGATASGDYSHAEGNNTLASGIGAHAEGSHTEADGTHSHVEGTYTKASRMYQHVFGKYNVEDTHGASSVYLGQYSEIVGNGTADNTRSNARALDWTGNEYLHGDLYVQCDNSSANGIKITPLPAVTSSDNGKVLQVVGGVWAAVQLPSASGVSF